MPDLTQPPTHHQQATAILTSMPAHDSLCYADALAMAQVHATLAMVDAVGVLDSALRDLHETLRSQSARSAY